MDFTKTCTETGEWNGEPVEGFVVRSHIAEQPTSNNETERDRSTPPYKSGSSFFFKVKFDEPYMMYRDWREVTKMLLSSKGQMKASNLPRSKMKRAETKVYVNWVIKEITKDRESFKGFAKGKGIIATREKFLKFLETKQGMEALTGVKNGKEKNSPGAATDKFDKTVIVPVAIPGCGGFFISISYFLRSHFFLQTGKTSVSLALAHIFGFGHTQSDDVHVKKSAPVFIRNVVDLLQKHDVVIADK